MYGFHRLLFNYLFMFPVHCSCNFIGAVIGAIAGGLTASAATGATAATIAGNAAVGGLAGASFDAQREANQQNISSARDANALSYRMFQEGQIFNREEAEKQRMWNDQFYKNQILYRKNDLERAGINPILAPNLTGVAPSMANASSPSPGSTHTASVNNTVTPAISSATQLSQNRAKISLMEQQREKVMVEVKNVMADTDFKKATTGLTYAQKEKIAVEMGYIRQQTLHVLETTKGAQQFNRLKQVIVDFVNSGELHKLARETGVGIHMLINLMKDIVLKVVSPSGESTTNTVTDNFNNIGEDVINRGKSYVDQFKKWMRDTRANYNQSGR
jgi:hypothetical protein